MSEEKTTTPPREVVNGCKRILVRHEKWAREKPYSLKELAEYVEVRILPFRDFPRALEIAGDDAALAALYLDCDVKWTDTLTEASLVEILKIGEELNFPRLAAYIARKEARVSGLMSSLVGG